MSEVSVQDLSQIIQEEVSAITGLGAQEIGLDTPFAGFGMESLQIVATLTSLEKRLERQLPITLLFDYPTIRELAAHLAQSKTEPAYIAVNSQARFDDPIVIIGLSCRFPGADSVQAFWNNLVSGVDAIKETPSDRWTWQNFPDPHGLRWGGFLGDIDSFDNDLFGISAMEAAKMDPQQRLLLQCTHEAIESTAYSLKDFQKTRTGVFIGISGTDFSVAKSRDKTKTDVFDATGNAHSIAANRISYLFNLKGPSLSIDTACSSSLVSAHEACISLHLGESDFAIVGGVNIILAHEISSAFAEAGMLAHNGRCKSFSAEADGYVRSEGVGVIILKRLSAAIQDGDEVIAVIRSSAINHDGKTNGLTAPSGPAQEAVIREALAKASLEPKDISFLEAHGTGTALGDPIEFITLSRIFGRDQNQVKVGSAKSFIGHMEAAAGIGGLIKTALSLQHRLWPKQLNFTSINPRMLSEAKLLHVADSETVMHEETIRAGVSSFGFGGTNAHLILETAPALSAEKQSLSSKNPPYWLTFSASSKDSLRNFALNWIDELKLISEDQLGNVCAQSQAQRMAYPQRIAAWGTTRQELIEQLQAWCEGKSPTQLLQREFKANQQTRIAFAFTGQGSQYPRMALELYQSQIKFRECFLECCSYLDAYFPQSLLRVLEAKSETEQQLLAQTDYGQALLFAVEYSLAQLLQHSFGLEPELVFGHSLGELVAAAFSGALTLADACKMVAARGILMQQKTAPGAMLSISAARETWTHLLDLKGLNVEIAAFNGPKLTTVSGGVEAIEALLQQLISMEIRAKRLQVARAFHSKFMDSAIPEFRKLIFPMAFREPRYLLISSVTGEALEPNTNNAEYWCEQIRKPTQFEKCVRSAIAAGINTIIEIGTQPILCTMGPDCQGDKKADWIPLLQKGQGADHAFYRAIAELILRGAMRANSGFTRIKLPTTPFRPSVFKRQASSFGPARADIEQESAMSQTKILAELQIHVANLLHVKPEELDPDANLTELGADSLLLLEAIQSIKDRHGVSIAIADIFRDLSSLRAIANYVEGNLPKAPKPVESTQIAQQMRQAAQTPIGNPSELKSIIDRQLELMNQQLVLLGGQPNVAYATALQASAAPSLKPIEAKGVLGNFRSRANQEVSTEEKAKAVYIQNFVERFNAKTPKTKAHTQRYRSVLADNRVSAGFRPNIKEMIYTTIFHKGSGSHFVDLDGNDFIDFSMGFGVNLFGHCPDFIEKRIREQLGMGYLLGPQSELAGVVADKVAKLVGHERVAFLNSGTEAVMTALRLARAATGRSKIVMFEGSYHGHADVTLARAAASGQSMPVAPGVPLSLVSDVTVLPYNDPSSIEFIRKNASELAAVIVEPVQSRYPDVQPAEFLREIRSITAKSGTAFIFDEVICGLRIAAGGAQEHFGIKADLASYGKILGGGMPIGAVAGSARFLDPIDGGHWQFGDDSYPKAEMTFFAGTFCKHPLAMAAADAVVDRLASNGNEIYKHLNERTEKLTKSLNEIFNSRGLEIQAVNFGSLFRFKANANLDLLFANLNLRGAYVWEGRNLFLSTAHSEQDLEKFLNIVAESTDELIKEGFLRKKP